MDESRLNPLRRKGPVYLRAEDHEGDLVITASPSRTPKSPLLPTNRKFRRQALALAAGSLVLLGASIIGAVHFNDWIMGILGSLAAVCSLVVCGCLLAALWHSSEYLRLLSEVGVVYRGDADSPAGRDILAAGTVNDGSLAGQALAGLIDQPDDSADALDEAAAACRAHTSRFTGVEA